MARDRYKKQEQEKQFSPQDCTSSHSDSNTVQQLTPLGREETSQIC